MTDTPQNPAVSPGDRHPDAALVAELEAAAGTLAITVAGVLNLAVMAATERLLRLRSVSGEHALAAAVGVMSGAALQAVHEALGDQVGGPGADELLSTGASAVIARAHGHEPGADA